MTKSTAIASLTSHGAQQAPREVFLQRRAKRAFSSKKWREAKSGLFYLILVGIGLLLGILCQVSFNLPGGGLCAFLIAISVLVPTWWYVEFRVAPRRQRARQQAAVDAVRKEQPEFRFGDGSAGRFKATDVLRVKSNMIIAIDADRLLVRTITNAEWPDEGVDWLFELPDNMDVDVADYPRRFHRGKKVPSLVFSSEEEDGFRANAFALDTDSIAAAHALVSRLNRQRKGRGPS